ncbi:FecR family protein [Marivibrio halodurans]|uniref:FecR family protein n=1 Tax=Marivibrio halodurans TaxID=2039722 RepID=A0A8J7S0N9_9PROT|nr:FecR family protein [Marivibrio halodurans]MBP5856544.1 FecR family protein [Marivibrio halodurans]
MSDSAGQTRDKASREATDWLILLQDDPEDRALRDRFEQWLNADSLNRAAWDATARAAQMMAVAPAVHAARWRPAVVTPSRPRYARTVRAASRFRSGARSRLHRRIAAATGAVAVAVCLVLLAAPDIPMRMRADIVTATAEVRSVALEDGTTVTLGPESAISVRYDPDGRQVDLLAGEAYFDVVSDPGRPFRVAAGTVRARVLGTRFDVWRGEEGTAVSVAEGRVRVENPAAAPPVSVILTKGRAARLDGRGAVRRFAVAPDQVASWRDGRLIAQDEPVEDVIDRLRPYHDGVILVAGSALADRTVTGVYNLDDPMSALSGIARAHGAAVRRITPWIVLVSGF